MSLQIRSEWAQRGLSVDLDLPPGRHAVTGPNGSGKSSLLAVVAGLARPDSSRVVLNGRVLDGVAPEKLEALGVRGILRQLARDGQIIDVRCEMPQCYCSRGRRHFDPISPGADWMPTADHYPRLKMHGGRPTPDNVRLAHKLCNQRDYIWRKKISTMSSGVFRTAVTQTPAAFESTASEHFTSSSP